MTYLKNSSKFSLLTEVNNILVMNNFIQINQKKLKSNKLDIEYHLGNFGEIPYGKTIVSYNKTNK